MSGKKVIAKLFLQWMWNLSAECPMPMEHFGKQELNDRKPNREKKNK